ncbi:MAG: hypothetical protein Q8Q09_05725 [Deltaproteobacteria bacterium]|nr:hypothetical protein [Deltaproteobacteria bacterium]
MRAPKSRFRSAKLAALCIFIVHCKQGLPDAPTESTVSESPSPLPPESRARMVFSSRCASCHGSEGRGDGVAAAGLQPRPRNFADPAWHDRANDAYLRRVIVEGGAAVGRSALMPPAPDLRGQPLVLDALVQQVRVMMHAAPAQTH